jgi:hypothetical protein
MGVEVNPFSFKCFVSPSDNCVYIGMTRHVTEIADLIKPEMAFYKLEPCAQCRADEVTPPSDIEEINHNNIDLIENEAVKNLFVKSMI